METDSKERKACPKFMKHAWGDIYSLLLLLSTLTHFLMPVVPMFNTVSVVLFVPALISYVLYRVVHGYYKVPKIALHFSTKASKITMFLLMLLTGSTFFVMRYLFNAHYDLDVMWFIGATGFLLSVLLSSLAFVLEKAGKRCGRTDHEEETDGSRTLLKIALRNNDINR